MTTSKRGAATESCPSVLIRLPTTTTRCAIPFQINVYMQATQTQASFTLITR